MHKIHRKKVTSLFKKEKNSALFITGAAVAHRYGTDYEYAFRQESNFLYLTGVDEPDFFALIDNSSGKYHLFVPKRDAMYAVWYGFVHSLESYKKKYQPDEIHYIEDLKKVLSTIKPELIHCIRDEDAKTVSGLGYKTETGTLADAIASCRVIKNEQEKSELQKASDVASEAHRAVMSAIQPGIMEYEMQALFEYKCMKNGLRHQPYSGIHAGGTGSSVLHYVENNRVLNDGDLFLLDAGAESNGYASDITRTYPVNGKFAKKQAVIYDVALEMLELCLENTRPGVEMEELQLMACRHLLERFVELKLVYGEVDELMDQNIFALFFPHGIGHFLGLDTHDVGGYPKGTDRIDRPGLRYLRARRLLEPGMVITIEPGIYFISALLEPAFENPLQAKYLNVNELKTYLDFGGIRIEDNLFITEAGHDNLTSVPKTRHDIEALMRK